MGESTIKVKKVIVEYICGICSHKGITTTTPARLQNPAIPSMWCQECNCYLEYNLIDLRIPKKYLVEDSKLNAILDTGMH